MLLFKNEFMFVGARKVNRSEFEACFITLVGTDGGACEMRCEPSVYEILSQSEKMKIYEFTAEYNPSYKNQMKIVSVA